MSDSFIHNVNAVHQRLSDVLEATPLQRNQYLSDLYNTNVWLKREDLSPVRSYKIRGAYSFIMQALDEAPEQKNFICASAGNHAQGFAHACRNFKCKGVIFMPQTTPQQKVMKTSAFGAPYIEIRLVGDGFDAANAAAKEYCEEVNGQMVPPFDHPRIMMGQATVAKEILEQFPSDEAIDHIIMPVGGGGLSSGMTKYLQGMDLTCDFTFVEPDLAPSLKTSLEKNERITLSHVDNFIDGAAVAQIGFNNFEQLKQFKSDQVQLIPTDRVCATISELLNIEGIVLEPAGALAIDALKDFESSDLRQKNIVCIASGGNFDFERLPEVKERALKFSGLKKYYILQFPQRPGALKEFLMTLGPEDDIARFEYLKKSARNFGSVLIGLETSKSDNFDALTAKMDKMGMRWQDITDNEILANLVV